LFQSQLQSRILECALSRYNLSTTARFGRGLLKQRRQIAHLGVAGQHTHTIKIRWKYCTGYSIFFFQRWKVLGTRPTEGRECKKL